MEGLRRSSMFSLLSVQNLCVCSLNQYSSMIHLEKPLDPASVRVVYFWQMQCDMSEVTNMHACPLGP
jgi:hypothetical protein